MDLPSDVGPGARVARIKGLAVAGALVVLLALHVLRCLNLFSPAGSFFSNEPLVAVDNSMHTVYAELGGRLIQKTGQPYGYIPTDMAGHPKTPIFDPGISAVESMVASLSFLSPHFVYKLFVLLSMLAVAVCSLAGLWLLGLRSGGLLLGWLLLIFQYWWALGLVFTNGGMNAWLLSASLGFLLLAATAKLARQWSWPLAALVAALTMLCPFAHPVGTLLVVIAAGSLLALRRRDWKRTGLFLLGCALLSLWFNRTWILSTWTHRHIAAGIGQAFGGAQSPLYLAREFWTEIRSAESPVKFVNRLSLLIAQLGMTGLGVAGLVWLRRRRDPRFWPLAVPFLVLGLLTFFSREIVALQNLQPFRLRFVWAWIGGVAATLLLVEKWRRPGPARLLVGATGAFALLYFLAFDVRPDITRLQVGFTDVQRRWIDGFNQMANHRGRILVEDGRGYRGIGVAAFHLATNTQWIGGPYIDAYITYHQVHFASGRLAGRPVADYSEKELQDFFRRYNIHWVVTFDRAAKDALDAKPGLVRRLREIEGLAYYDVLEKGSFFERGSGTVEVDLDLIRLRDVKPDDRGSVVIRYHYYERLVVEGARELREVPVPGDPVGFIEVVQPGPTVTIRSRQGLR